MPSCVVCSSGSGGSRRKDVTLFSFPKDANRLHQWLVAVRSHLKPPWTVEKIRELRESGKNAFICSDHFSPTCCKENIKMRFHPYTNTRGAKLVLTEDAVPSLFGEETSHKSSEIQRDQRSTKQDGNPPMTGVVGFSMETTLALLPRMYMEELLSELDRRNIVVKISDGNRPRGRDDLEHVLKEVMMREYEESEGLSDADEDLSDNRSSFEQDPPLVNDDNREITSNQRDSMASAELAPELSQTTLEDEKDCSQTEDDLVHEMSHTQACILPAEVWIKKEPEEENNELCVTASSTRFNNVTVKTEPSTSDSEHPGIGHGSHPSMVSAPNFVVKVKTEPGVEEYLPDNVNISSESCVSLPGQRFQELKMVKVTNAGNKSSSSTLSKNLPDFVPSCTSGPSRTAARHPAPVYNSGLTSVSSIGLTQADPDPH